MWVRADGVFEAIVDRDLFEAAQTIIAERSRRLSDDELLDGLRRLFEAQGYLSGLIIDETIDRPSSSAYRHRFGSLLRAYRLVGYTPRRDYRYIEINRALRRLHPEMVDEIVAGLEASRCRRAARDGYGPPRSQRRVLAFSRHRTLQGDTDRRPTLAAAVRHRTPSRTLRSRCEWTPAMPDRSISISFPESTSRGRSGSPKRTSSRSMPTDSRPSTSSTSSRRQSASRRLPDDRPFASPDHRDDPVDAVHVLNPRARNRRQHLEIVENISTIGLKRPITVSRRKTDDGICYDLVCGEGRLEAFRILGEPEIPAVVIDVAEADCLVMSLVENIARRLHRPIDLMAEIGNLSKRGYNDAEIAEKTGCSRSWVKHVVTLLERGEERLVAAVEAGLIPIAMATEIAQAKSDEAQAILIEAYESGKIRGKKLAAVRRLLDRRLRKRKGVKDGGLGRRSHSKRPTADELLRVYQREADKQRLLATQSGFTQARLLFIIEAMKDLLADEGFITLLRAEGLAAMPQALATRIDGEVRT